MDVALEAQVVPKEGGAGKGREWIFGADLLDVALEAQVVLKEGWAGKGREWIFGADLLEGAVFMKVLEGGKGKLLGRGVGGGEGDTFDVSKPSCFQKTDPDWVRG